MILPSYLKRKRKEESSGHCASKRPKPVQVWDRDIVCLPSSHGSVGNIPFPRGKFRTKLGEKGLIGKIRLTSQMSVLEVEDEIRSVFQGPMGGSNDFCFHFLQSTGLGSKTLTLPSVSSSFIWTPQQVARLGNNKQPIYIMADDELACCLDSEVSCILSCIYKAEVFLFWCLLKCMEGECLDEDCMLELQCIAKLSISATMPKMNVNHFF